MKAVFASHSAFDPVLRVGSHHLSREFARAGWETSHVSTPISLTHLLRLREPGVRRRFGQAIRSQVDADGVTRIVPLTVRPVTRLSPAGATSEVSRAMRRWTPVLKRPDFLIIDQPLLVDLIAILHPRRVIYRPTDAHYDDQTREAELRVLRASDAVVATSQRVLNEVLAELGLVLPTLVLENGVEYDHFVGRSDARDGVCYVGAIDHRFDWAFVVDAALAVPSTRVDVIGPITASPPDSLPSNVRILPPVEYDAVPSVLRSYRVGMLPFNGDPGNAGRSPMKYYEYLAAGLNILATPTPTLLARQQAPGVWFLQTTVRAAVLAALGAPENEGGIQYARAFGWHSRSAELRSFLEDLP